MKTIIAGGRDLFFTIDSVMRDVPWEISEVVSGNARGIDRMGEWWAANHNIPIKRFPADWDTHGKAAGPIRNREMAVYADALVLIWDGESKGSASMLREAKRAGLRVHEHRISHKSSPVNSEDANY